MGIFEGILRRFGYVRIDRLRDGLLEEVGAGPVGPPPLPPSFLEVPRSSGASFLLEEEPQLAAGTGTHPSLPCAPEAPAPREAAPTEEEEWEWTIAIARARARAISGR